MIKLCHQNEISEGQTRGFEVAGINLFALKKAGEIYLYRNRCPHLGLNLEFQPDDFLNYDGSYIQCSTHGAQFTLQQGLCVLGPCKGKSLQALNFTLQDEVIFLSEPLPREEATGG